MALKTSSSPLELASDIGRQFFGSIGQEAFIELELAFASRMINRFSDKPDFRARQNLMLYWDKSYLKGRFLDVFSRTLPSGSWTTVDSATTETMFGSISDDGQKLYYPLFHGKQFCFIPELLTFLQSGDPLRAKVPVLNQCLEGDDVHRNLIKFVKADKVLIDSYALGVDGLYFDGKQLYYKPETCFIVASHPFDNRTWTYLDASGFFSRFHTLQVKLTNQDAERIFTEEIRCADMGKVQQLQNFNSQLAPRKVSCPEDKLLSPIYERAIEKAKVMMERHPNLDLTQILNLRIKGDLTREVASYKLLEPEKVDSEVQEWIYKRLDHFFNFLVSPSIAEPYTVRAERQIDVCERKLKERFEGQEFKRSEALDYLKNEQGFTRPTIDRVLKKYALPEKNMYYKI